MIFYLNSLPGGGGSDSNLKPLFENGSWNLDKFTINPSTAAPFGYEINQDGYIVSLSTNNSERDSGFVIVPNDAAKKYGYVFILANDSNIGRAQFGRCQRNADAYTCQQTGEGRISYNDIFGYSNIRIYGETAKNANEAEFIAFGKGMSIMGIYYFLVD